jgi:hypothetical protein
MDRAFRALVMSLAGFAAVVAVPLVSLATLSVDSLRSVPLFAELRQPVASLQSLPLSSELPTALKALPSW